MDTDRFDALARSFAPGATRRAALQLLAGGLAALVDAAATPGAKATHFGCRHVGTSCTTSDECCSGRCRGPKGRKRCRAHHTRGCTKAMDICRTSSGASPCPDAPGGTCFITIGGAPFCGTSDGAGCERCRSDRDCVEKFGYPRGSACLYLGAGPRQCDITCGGSNDGRQNDTACYPPAA